MDKPAHVFDGFCSRPYDETTDGWIELQPDVEDYPSVRMASDIIAMYEEIKYLRKKLWEKEKTINHYEDLLNIKKG